MLVENDQCQPFEYMKFYWNRFARIMPTYYLCTLIAIPLVFIGYNGFVRPLDFVPSLIVSLVPTSTLFTISKGYPIGESMALRKQQGLYVLSHRPALSIGQKEELSHPYALHVRRYAGLVRVHSGHAVPLLPSLAGPRAAQIRRSAPSRALLVLLLPGHVHNVHAQLLLTWPAWH